MVGQLNSLLNNSTIIELYFYPSQACRAGYRSKIFDIDTDTDTLSSIPVPERYFFRYQFYEISFNKITLSQKTLVLFFSAC